MSMHGETGCPEAVLASIAWYPDALDEAQRGRVEAHAAACAACRDELAFVQGEREPDLPLPDADRVYAGVLARIEQSETGASERVAAAPRAGARRRARSAVASAFAARPAALAAGLALALLCGALGGLWLAPDVSRAPGFETASQARGAAAPPSAGPALDVVFRADVPTRQVHDALRAIGGQIVAGPTQLGVYRVELAPGANAAAAARLLEGGLQGASGGGDERGVATFAQPAR